MAAQYFVDLWVMCRGVALPSYKIPLLFPLAKELLFQNGLNFPFRCVVNNVRWWFKKIWSVFISFSVWVKREVWKTLWIFHALGRLIWYTTWDILVATSKGLYRLSDSFGVPSILFKLVPSNHTLSLGWYSLKRGVALPSCLSCALHMASRAAVLDSLIFSRHCHKSEMSMLWVGWWVSRV